MTMPLLFLLALMQAPPDVPAAPDTVTYATPALRMLVSEAAAMNRRVPPSLGGYRARLETEISVGGRRSEGMEMAVSIEQVAGRLEWDRTGAYEQVIDGYRSQSIGASFATVGFFHSGWAIPSLYGNRIALLYGRDTSHASERRRRRRGAEEPTYAVHPLADDRDRFYRFSGGDTIITMRLEGREVPIVRVTVSLKPDVPTKSIVFLGELDLDASRRHIVRLRGYFATVGGRKRWLDPVRGAGLRGIEYVEVVNAEVNGEFWLPSYQRFEAHATSNTVGEGRAILRIVTRFSDREITPVPSAVHVGATGDTLAIRPFRLTVGSPDSLRMFRSWATDLGTATAQASAEDFSDVAPDQWSSRGPRRLTLETERLGDVIRLDRVQGAFTGLGGVLRFRDELPGLAMRAAAGYAWSERTARGRFIVEHRRGSTLTALRVQRSLDLTNDFRNPYDSGSTIGALLGNDDYDYVDRRSASLQLRRFLRRDGRASWRIEVGVADDHPVHARLTRSPLGLGGAFRSNRLVVPGTYAKSAITAEWRPDVSLEFLRTGVGARLHYERGDGDLSYERTEARVTVRTNRGPFSFGARLDAGITSPGAPTQQLFEVGKNQNLPGYKYKEFAGDQAVVMRGLASFRLPYLAAPLMITDRFWLPPVAPTLALGVQAGWARASTAEAMANVAALGSIPTGHPRSSASMTMRFFGSAIGLGAARPLDYPGGWRWIIEFGQRP